MEFDNLYDKITSSWIRTHAPNAICTFGTLPRIPLPNTDRDSGSWCLGIDRKHEHTTVILYCNFGLPTQSHRRIATITTKRELIKLYEHLAGDGAWEADHAR